MRLEIGENNYFESISAAFSHFFKIFATELFSNMQGGVLIGKEKPISIVAMLRIFPTYLS